MKILIINSVYGYGSTGKIVYEAARFLREKGHDVAIAYGRHFEGRREKDENVYRIGNNLNIALSGVMARLDDKDGFVGRVATREFLKWASEYDPDIVWAHNLHGYYFHIGLFAEWIKKSKAKLVWTLHDCWTFTGHCAHYSAAGCKGFLSGCSKCPHKDLYPKALFSKSERNYSRKKDLLLGLGDKTTFVAPSAWLADQMETSYLAKQRIEVIHNGIDLDVFKVLDKNGEKTPKSILCVANIWTKNKGIDDVVALSKIIDSDWRLTLIGGLPQGVSLPSRINYVRRTDSKAELVRLYNASEILFNPTHEDNFPTVNMEALACHCIPVCYRVGGIPEVVPDRFLVDEGDCASAYETMKKISNHELDFDYSTVQRFSKKTTYQQYEELFASLLSK